MVKQLYVVEITIGLENYKEILKNWPIPLAKSPVIVHELKDIQISTQNRKRELYRIIREIGFDRLLYLHIQEFAIQRRK